MRDILKRIPIIGYLFSRTCAKLKCNQHAVALFPGSAAYWEARYSAGGDSGVGSYAQFAEFKAEVLNAFVAERNIQAIVEFGCGDGNQLTLAQYPRYLGLDVSSTVVSKCRHIFQGDSTKSFATIADYNGEKAELALSLDVIYHLVEDSVFEVYMRTLFQAATHYVIIYASDCEGAASPEVPHVRHRQFTLWIQQNLPDWKQIDHVPNRHPYREDYRQGSSAEFFIYAKA